MRNKRVFSLTRMMQEAVISSSLKYYPFVLPLTCCLPHLSVDLVPLIFSTLLGDR